MSADEPHAAATESAEPTPERRRRSRARIVIWIVVLLAFAILLWWLVWGRTTGKRRAPGAPATVTAAIVKQGDMHVYLDAIGTVTALHTVSVASQVTGQLVAVHYQEGQRVKKGDPLLDIDPRPLRALLLQAEGTLERDLQVLAQAQMDLARFRAAWDKRAIAEQQLADQEKLVLQSEGTVKIDRGTVEYNRVQLSYAHITSPVDGRVGLRLVDPGNLVFATTGTPLVVITQVQPITVVFTVSEDQLGELTSQAGHGTQLPVDVFDRTSSRKLASGTLYAIDNQVDTTTGTVKVRAQFDNANDELFPNQFVNTRVLVRMLRGVTIVPSSAIQRNGDVSFVYVLRAGRAHMQQVTTGVSEAGMTQVEGVTPGTQVANSGFERLREGAPVVIVEQPAPEAGGARAAP